MPINIPDDLPTAGILKAENIFVAGETRSLHQDIRPLEIAILNIMPTKITTETQLLRLLGNTPLQVNVTLFHPKTHVSKNTPREHLLKFYTTFDCIERRKFDGLIVTGAPVEHLEFEEVDYWEELVEIMEWAKTNVFAAMFICWGAQAGLYHYYGVPKYPLGEKKFGVFSHYAVSKYVPLFRGFDDRFFAPHSRYTEVRKEDIEKVKEIEVVSESPEAGVYIVLSRDGRKLFITGHPEYDADTLKKEYERDISKGISIAIPENYFPDDDPSKEPVSVWRSHANLLFSNWLNYYVYQETPYEIESIGAI